MPKTKEVKRQEAEERQHVCSLIHPEVRLLALAHRPGGSAKETAKLEATLKEMWDAATVDAPAPTKTKKKKAKAAV